MVGVAGGLVDAVLVDGGLQEPLTDTAWMCLDLNANQLSTMPPYLKNAAPTLIADWLNNPDPDCYTSWEEFAKQLFWDYQLGEAFVLATARYSTGWPARFHVVPPWWVAIEMDDGRPPIRDRRPGRHRRHAAHPLPVAGRVRARPSARWRRAGTGWSRRRC